jgi:hypothetical protein
MMGDGATGVGGRVGGGAAVAGTVSFSRAGSVEGAGRDGAAGGVEGAMIGSLAGDAGGEPWSDREIDGVVRRGISTERAKSRKRSRLTDVVAIAASRAASSPAIVAIPAETPSSSARRIPMT